MVLASWWRVRESSLISADSRALGPSEVPWLFREGTSTWASTSAELLSSLVARHLLRREFGSLWQCPGCLKATFAGGTDNRATEAVTQRMLTTKVPLMFVLMQYECSCDVMGIRCLLSWRPRDANVEADNITKNRLEGFNPDLRLKCQWSEIDLSVLRPLLAYGNFSEALLDAKSLSASGIATGPRFEKSH